MGSKTAPKGGPQTYMQMNGQMADNLEKKPSEIPKDVMDYIQDIARPDKPLDPMENQESKCELSLEHLVLVDHGKAFKRRRIGLAAALADGRPLPPETPVEGGI
jgi:hypothetical protein